MNEREEQEFINGVFGRANQQDTTNRDLQDQINALTAVVSDMKMIINDKWFSDTQRGFQGYCMNRRDEIDREREIKQAKAVLNQAGYTVSEDTE